MLGSVLLITSLLIGADELPVVRMIPATAKIEVGHSIILKAETNGKELKWVKPELNDKDCQLETLTEDGKKVIFLARKPGVYRVLVYTALGNVPSEVSSCIVIVGEVGPGPDPKPPGPEPPKPPPPGPVNPLAEKFQRAYNLDTNPPEKKRKWREDIAGLFEGMALHVRKTSIKTIGDLLSDYETVKADILPPGVLLDLRKLIGVELFNATGDDSEKEINSELRKSLEVSFLSIATALKGVKE